LFKKDKMFKRLDKDAGPLHHPALLPLARELWRMGYSISLPRDLWWTGVRDAVGYHEGDLKRVAIVTTFKGEPRTVGDLAFALAHELRHAQHERDGLYSAYYRDFSGLPMSALTATIAVGYRAELDCDQFARNYLKKVGLYSTLVHRRYPRRKVAMFRVYQIRRILAQMTAAIIKARKTGDNTNLSAYLKEKQNAYEKWAKDYRPSRHRQQAVRNRHPGI